MLKRLLTVLMIATLLCSLNRIAFALSGVVQDTNKRVISGATLRILVEIPNTRTQYENLQSDASGKFSLPPQAATTSGFYVIYAFADGYCFEPARVPISESENTVITMKPEYVVKGLVIDETGEPISGVKVYLTTMGGAGKNGRQIGYGESFTDGYPISATTEGDGTFALKQMPNPEEFYHLHFELWAEKPGYVSGGDRCEKQGERNDLKGPITITLPRDCTIEGILYAPDGSKAPAGIPLTFRAIGPQARVEATAYTDKNGVFNRSQLQPGKYSVTLGVPYWYTQNAGHIKVPDPLDWTMQPQILGVEFPETIDMKLTMNRGAVIQGQVLGKITRKPLKGALVTAQLKGSDTIFCACVSDENGKFSLRAPAGKILLTMRALEQEKDVLQLPPQDMPAVSLDLSDGETRTGIVVEMRPPEKTSTAEEDTYRVSLQPTIKDFQLTPGSYRLIWDNEVVLKDNGVDAAHISSQLREKIRKTPEFESKKPVFAALKFDGDGDNGMLVMAFDESGGTGTGYDTAYMDLNRNLDLTDDKPVTWQWNRDTYSARSIWTTAQESVRFPGQKPVVKSIDVRLEVSHFDNNLYPSVIRKGAWRCKLSSNGGSVDCILADMNHNGIWGDAGEYKLGPDGRPDSELLHWGWEPGEDYLYIDNNGHGHAVTGPNSSHGARLYKLTRIVDRYYDLRISPDGRLVVPAGKPKLGKLHIYTTDFGGKPGTSGIITLIGEQGVYEIESHGRPVDLPAGRWRIDGVALNIAAPLTPYLCFSCNLGRAVIIRPGQQLDIDLTGKLTFSPDPIHGKAGQEAQFCWRVLIGNIGYAQFIGMATGGHIEDLEKHHINIYDSSGKLLAKAEATETSASNDGRCGAKVRIPDIPPGEYKIDMDLNVGRELGVLKGVGTMTVLPAR